MFLWEKNLAWLIRAHSDPAHLSTFYETHLLSGTMVFKQTDKEIQNPVSEPKIAAHTPIHFAV